MSNTQGTAARVALAAGGDAKVPRTERGRRTLRKLLDAAAEEFGEKGFHEASVSSITRRAEVALGSFYTYFDSKDALFRALVADMSEKVRTSARSALTENMGALEIERAALAAFLHFAAEHKEIYRIIDEAEFVDPASYRQH
jgi:AcrR family transcriptional regulator